MMIIRQDYNWDTEDPPTSFNVEGVSNSDILQKFPKELRHMIGQLWLDGIIGICSGNIQISSLNNFQKDEIDKVFYADSFTLSVPFAGHSLMWDVMFTHKDLLFAPDIIFDDETFLFCPQLLKIIKHNVSSLSKWNPYDPKALINVIREYLVLYKQHHVNTLIENEKYSRIYFEYSSLVGEIGVAADEVEVLIEPSEIVHFLISIPIDFSSLPPYIQESDSYIGNPGLDAAMLLVTFHRLDGSKIEPHLRLSPHVEQVIGGAGNKCIPSFPIQGCLMDYVPEVRKILADRVEAVSINHRMKNEYITQLLARYGCSVIEYDCLTFSKITMLFENKNFYWLLVITLGNRFPQEKPKLLLRSVYHMTCGAQNKPYMEALPDYPYSPRWSPDEMIQRTLIYTFENITSFQNASILKSHNI